MKSAKQIAAAYRQTKNADKRHVLYLALLATLKNGENVAQYLR